MSARRGETGESGFLYQELMAALAIVAVAAAAGAPMVTLAARRAAAAQDTFLAATLADAAIESLSAQDLAAIAPGADQARQGPTVFSRSWTVARDQPQPGLTTITVTVTARRGSAPPARPVVLRVMRAR